MVERDGPINSSPSSISLPLLLRPPILSEKDPTYMVAFNLNYLLKTLSPDPVTLKFNA